MPCHTRESSFLSLSVGAHQQERHRDRAQRAEEDEFDLGAKHPEANLD